jgi:hypothetical protein
MTRTPLLLDARHPCMLWHGPLVIDARQVRCCSCGWVVPAPSFAALDAALALFASGAACGLVVAGVKLAPMLRAWVVE